MAKTIKQLENKLRIKYLIKDEKYFLMFGSMHPLINGKHHLGFETIEEAEIFGNSLYTTNNYCFYTIYK